MLIFNVNIPDKLFNGALGTIIDFVFNENGSVQAIIVQFDDPNAGIRQLQYLKINIEQVFTYLTKYDSTSKLPQGKY